MDMQTKCYYDLQISRNTEITKPNVKDADIGKPKCLWYYNLVMGGEEDHDTGRWIILKWILRRWDGVVWTGLM
jgi:hypothetical protein